MPDGLHPNLKGYEIFANAIREPVRQLLAEPVRVTVPSIVNPPVIALLPMTQRPPLGLCGSLRP